MNDNQLTFEGELSFEDFKHENGITYWWASDFMKMLGYTSLVDFKKVINKATKIFMSLNIEHGENIILTDNNGDKDYKLTRFACYLTAMNGDIKKPEVAKAQVYFAEQTRKFELSLTNSEQVERLSIRDELTESNKALNTTAKERGVENYALFKDAGYRGMYNNSLGKMTENRGIKKEKFLDSIGKDELIANAFMVSQTNLKIKNNNITGQKALEKAHNEVGQSVRKEVIKNTGKAPEELPVETLPISAVKKELKKANKGMIEGDKNTPLQNTTKKK